jgi:aminopeptidase N
MHAYFSQHRWGNTRAEDLWAAFDSASGEQVSEMLAGFIEQPGVPLVSLSLEPGGRLRLTQRRFSTLGNPELPGRWQVPVILSWSSRGRVQQARVLLKESSQVVDLPGLADADWVYPNAAESGYYRWQLSPELNARLLRRGAALSPVERLGVLDNAAALLDAGKLGGGDYLALLAAYAGDPEPEIVAQVADSLGGIRDIFLAARMHGFRAVTSALLRPALDRIGLQPAANEPPEVGPLRTRLYYQLGIYAGDPAVAAAARDLAARYLQEPGTVDASLAGAALAVTAFHGDAATFAQFQSALERTDLPAARDNLISALGSFHDPELAARALSRRVDFPRHG